MLFPTLKSPSCGRNWCLLFGRARFRRFTWSDQVGSKFPATEQEIWGPRIWLELAADLPGYMRWRKEKGRWGPGDSIEGLIPVCWALGSSRRKWGHPTEHPPTGDQNWAWEERAAGLPTEVSNATCQLGSRHSQCSCGARMLRIIISMASAICREQANTWGQDAARVGGRLSPH